MSKNQSNINLARIIYASYQHSDLLAVDPERDCESLNDLMAKVESENIGDGLFGFIVTEIVEGTDGSPKEAVKVLQRGKDDIDAVLSALKTALSEKSANMIKRNTKLYEVKATEYNGQQEYDVNKLLAARDIKDARRKALEYFGNWYDDGCQRQMANRDEDEIEFLDGAIKVRIDSITETSIDRWIDSQIQMHSISPLPEKLPTTSEYQI